MKLPLIFSFLISTYCLNAQLLDATLSFNGSGNLVITINTNAAFQFNQTHTGGVSLIIEEVYGADPGNYTTSVNGGSGISYTSSNGNSGTASQMGAFGFDFNLYTIRDEELTFPDPGPSFTSGDVMVIQAGTVIGTSSHTGTPPINAGPYVAYIISDDYNTIAAPQIVLPVEFLDFNGSQQGDEVMLTWNTASETNNDKFEIQESMDGYNFYKVGEVSGNGTTSKVHNYQFLAKSPQSKSVYYRIKQIDFDGKFDFSKVINVKIATHWISSSKLYPNPCSNGIAYLDYPALENISGITVYDVNGNIIINQLNTVSTNDERLVFNFNELTTGLYIIRLESAGETEYHRLTIE